MHIETTGKWKVKVGFMGAAMPSSAGEGLRLVFTEILTCLWLIRGSEQGGGEAG